VTGGEQTDGGGGTVNSGELGKPHRSISGDVVFFYGFRVTARTSLSHQTGKAVTTTSTTSTAAGGGGPVTVEKTNGATSGDDDHTNILVTLRSI
jgi:hypothetical protein